MGLILVIGICVFVFSMVVAATALAVNGVKQAQQRTFYEQSLGVAEQGIDKTMSNLQTAFSRYNADYPVPGTSWSHAVPAAPQCNRPSVAWPATLGGTPVSDSNGTFVAANGATAEQNERAWAMQQLAGLAADPSCLVRDTSGKDKSEYVVLKPVTTLVNGLYPKYGKVYALSAIPSFVDAKAVRRLVKAEYIFMPYRPTHAILTGGNLELQGDTKVLPAHGVAAGVSGVHANGDITVTGGSAHVDGPVTASGEVHDQSGSLTQTAGSTTKVDIPTISAEDFYYQASSKVSTAVGGWYDLCDGQLRAYSLNGPCTGTPILGTTRNWQWTSATRTWTATPGVLPGTYYAHQASVTNGTGQASLQNLTVIASRDDSGPCTTRQYGNITWDHYDILSPSFPNMWLFADGDVEVTSNIRIGQNIAPAPVSGMIIAGDQLELYTQSNSAVGAVLAGDQCKPDRPQDSLIETNVVHSDLYYDPHSDAPFTSVITNTLWLDYSH